MPSLGCKLGTPDLQFYFQNVKRGETIHSERYSVNSLYDPLGFAPPITVKGKALVRDLSFEQYEWDTPLPKY